MTLLPESVDRSSWFNFRPSSVLLLALGRGFGTARTYLMEYRKARNADALYADLLRLSNGEAAERGLGREQLAQHIKDRFY